MTTTNKAANHRAVKAITAQHTKLQSELNESDGRDAAVIEEEIEHLENELALLKF